MKNKLILERRAEIGNEAHESLLFVRLTLTVPHGARTSFFFFTNEFVFTRDRIYPKGEAARNLVFV